MTPVAVQAELFGITLENKLITIDRSTGAGTLIGTVGPILLPIPFGLSDRDGRLFTFDQSRDVIVELDPLSAAIIGTFDVGLPNLVGEGSIAFDSTGTGFVAEAKIRDSSLYQFDIDSLSSSFVGNLPSAMDGLDFDCNGKLLALNNVFTKGDTYKLYEIDESNAFGILKGDTNVVREDLNLAGLTFDKDGTLFAVMNDILFEISPTDGSVINEIGPTGFSGVSGLTAIEFVPVPEPVPVDIKPGSCPNPFRLLQDVVDLRGQLPVAILGTEDFDVTTIDPVTIRMTREGVDAEVEPLRSAYEDVATPFEGELCDCHDLNGDGYMDLTLKFDRKEVAEALKLWQVLGQTIPFTIAGNLNEEYADIPIAGQDCVWVKPKVKGKVKIEPIDDSGVYGKARLVTREDGTTKVILKGLNALTPGEAYTANIRSGSCDGVMLFNLSDVIVNKGGIGRSVTIVDAPINFDTWWIEVGGLTCGKVKLR
jgi:hypothetical protein